MNPSNLPTASVYINNLLLSRGLLRNGVPIPFAKPSDAEGGGGTDATMARIMNLVHDLVLRRDREADTLSTLSHNLQTLRTTTIQQTQTIARHESRNAELDRQLALAGAQERAAKATLRSAESRTRALREEMGRLKVTVAQIRGQCANDIRRRDGEISRLKRHLEGRKGRDGNGGQVGVVVVTAGVGGKVQQQQQQQQQQQRGGLGNSAAEAEMGVESPQYTLKQETTEFLTQLSQSLSDENDALIGLVRSSLTTLRGLQGLPTSVPETSGGAQGPTGTRVEYANVILTPPASFEILATGMDEVLEHLRGLLTNPSFVPIEEVEIREDEIVRLREAWEKMEARWREAVALMDGWRKRMTESGDSINLDDLRMGLDLGSGFDVPPNQEHEEMIAEDGENDGVDFGSAYEESSYDLVEADAGELTGAETIAQARSKGFLPRGGAPLNPGGNVLSQGSGNVRPVSPREIPFSSIPEGHTKDRGTENVPADEVALLDFSDLGAPPQPVSDQKKSRLPRHTPQSSIAAPMTVQQKLDKVQAEAEEARTREQKIGRRKSVTMNKIRAKPSRRRSTLSPEELESLMGVGG